MAANIKNNPLVCGLLGVLIGSGGTLGGQALLDNNSKRESSVISTRNNFELVPYDEDGDAYITKHGTKYHNEGCPSLSNSKEIQLVYSADAEQAGLEPCSRCH